MIGLRPSRPTEPCGCLYFYFQEDNIAKMSKNGTKWKLKWNFFVLLHVQQQCPAQPITCTDMIIKISIGRVLLFMIKEQLKLIYPN